MSCTKAHTAHQDMELCQKQLENGTVLYQSGNVIQKRMAYQISLSLSEMLSTAIPFASELRDEAAINWILCDDKDLTDGRFEIRVCDKDVMLFAGSYYGYEGIARVLRTDAASEIYALHEGASLKGSYLDHLRENEESNRYAYDRHGDHRVMFYNFLFHNGSGRRKETLPEDIPVVHRNPLQQEMIDQYRPDVIGAQELAYSKRAAAGYYDMALLLSDIGYKETFDPRVPNIDFSYPYSMRNCFPYKKGNNTYYTYCNCTPLFYNSKTTKCIKSGYHYYDYHFGEECERKNAGEAATKTLTWGVFESKKTRDRYIVLNTHMGGPSYGEFVQLYQAQEAVRIARDLQKKYDNAPVFIGGDMNGMLGSQNYDYFAGPEAGYVNLQNDDVAREYTSKILTDKGYPCIDPELGFMVPDKINLRFSVKEPRKTSIDHVFLSDPEKAEVNVFGIVFDECSLSASDHLPMFVDFNIKK